MKSSVAQQAQQHETQLRVQSLLVDLRAAAGRDDKYQTLLQSDVQHGGLRVVDGLAYSRSGAVYVPDDRRLRTRLLELAHDAVGHFGRDRTIKRLAQHCVWTGMTRRGGGLLPQLRSVCGQQELDDEGGRHAAAHAHP